MSKTSGSNRSKQSKSPPAELQQNKEHSLPMIQIPLSEIRFTPTERIVALIQFINDNKQYLDEKKANDFSQKYLPFGHIESSPIPKTYLLALIEDFDTITKANKDLKIPEQLMLNEKAGEFFTLLFLVKGASIAPQGALPSDYTPAFQKYLSEIRVQQTRMEYRQMVSDLPGYKEKIQRNFGMAIKGTTKDLTVAANVILIMITGFIVFWYIGRMIWQHNKANQLACGIVGVMLALFLETLVLIFHYRREDIVEERKEQRKLKSLS